MHDPHKKKIESAMRVGRIREVERNKRWNKKNDPPKYHYFEHLYQFIEVDKFEVHERYTKLTYLSIATPWS